MVKIRYSELPAGLHVRVHSDGRRTVIYLLPGLSSQHRRAALLRARSSARMGHGPELPALAMVRAVAADRLWTTARNGLAATRRHPMLVLPPLVLLVSGAIVLVLVSFVRLTIPQAGQTSNRVPTLPINDYGGGHARHPHRSPTVSPPQPGSQTGQVVSRTLGGHGKRRLRRPRPSPDPSPTSFRMPSPYPSPSSSSLSPSPSPSPWPSPSPSGDCLIVGPLGFCLIV